MKILVIGGGGREHALAWKLAQSPLAEVVFVAPGNPGTAKEPKVQNLPIAASDILALKTFAQREAIGLTVVGPEAPLVAGIVDTFQDAGLCCFGPTRAAARLEGSKVFAKDFLARHGIPSAAYRSFTELAPALDHVRQIGVPLVIKADGLAAGKGVILAADLATAEAALVGMLATDRFGEAGRRVVVESFLTGEEASFIVICDGEDAEALASAQDHKARDEGDQGPNTGGMGAYSPAPVVTPEVHQRVMREVIQPTLAGLVAEGCPYRGFLYAGLMIPPDGTPQVLEFNCRLGDPETQPILMRLQSDLVTLILAACEGRLSTVKTVWDPRPSLGVVMAAGGYPDAYERGHVITGLDEGLPDTQVFHAGTASVEGRVVTQGGRVLCVTALGDSIRDAQAKAYARARQITWKGAFYRRDIGYRALNRA